MGVPAHDPRDFDFAKKFDFEIIKVIDDKKTANSLPNVEKGILINSSQFNGLQSDIAKEKITNFFQNNNLGEEVVTYRLRDWGISRQRYWGCPIPVIHCDSCGIVPVPETDLPVELPVVIDFEAHGNPLSNHPTWKHVNCPTCSSSAIREQDKDDRRPGDTRPNLVTLSAAGRLVAALARRFLRVSASARRVAAVHGSASQCF
mgnify:CR=1 FL=1